MYSRQPLLFPRKMSNTLLPSSPGGMGLPAASQNVGSTSRNSTGWAKDFPRTSSNDPFGGLTMNGIAADPS